LLRTVGLAALIIYGVGDMVGAGIYATIGQAAGLMGNAVWIAFLGSMIAAMLTGLSYACISSRYPRAAGAAFVTQRAFALPLLSYVIGLVITASGMTSIATNAHAFKDALRYFVPALHPLVALGIFLVALTLINLRGIKECVAANIVCTTIEVGGLLFVIAVSLRYFGSINYFETPVAHPDLDLGLVLSGAVLTFYAFVGFEDLLNLSEEVKEPRRNMPLGIVFAVIIATILYILGFVRRLGRSLCRLGRCDERTAAGANHSESGELGAARALHLHHTVCRVQHCAHELHYGIAPFVRDGAAGVAATVFGPRAPHAADALPCNRDALRSRRCSDANGQNQRVGLSDKPSAPVLLQYRECGSGGFETPERRTAGGIRGARCHPFAWHHRLRRIDRRARSVPDRGSERAVDCRRAGHLDCAPVLRDAAKESDDGC
jgi:hypothetical protein